MILSDRIGQRDLAQLCLRLATALESGVEARRVFTREATGRAPAAVRMQLERVREAVATGYSLQDALALTGNFFPPFFHEMVAVGEQTGHAAEIFRHLAEHYDHQVRLKRAFLQAITWPMVQLAAALGIVAILIWVMGFINARNPRGQPIDILGFGLIGTPGLLRYAALLAGVALVLVALYECTRRGMFWTGPIERAVLRVPVLGPALRTLALARLAWSLQLTYGVGMDLQRALELSLRSTQNRYYTDHCEDVVRSMRRGQQISEALAATGVFPPEFLDAIEVGETSGRLPETMATLSAQYQDRAQRALESLGVVAGFLVWAAVAALITLLIFRIFSFYISQLEQAMR
ncbi:MAG TPA: type II secretion system F family protein [Pirellulales bacterium]|nr:type II secretion system F family protein [Pirellulales bacterium]